jgi:hypothetical protein
MFPLEAKGELLGTLLMFEYSRSSLPAPTPAVSSLGSRSSWPDNCTYSAMVDEVRYYLKRGFLDILKYFIQHCFICHPSDFTVSEEAGNVATLALAV